MTQNGTRKFYMGREIAQVMGSGGIEWLDRLEREEEEHPVEVLNALDLQPGAVVADWSSHALFHRWVRSFQNPDDDCQPFSGHVGGHSSGLSGVVTAAVARML